MKIYHYNATNGAYIGDGMADIDPLEAGKYLIPACATEIAPPEQQEGKVVIFDAIENAWMYVDEMFAETPKGTPAQKMTQIRAIRNQLLSMCDWTQLSDGPMSTEEKQQWAAYRQALRDFTATVDLDNVVWPEANIVSEV